MSNYTSFYKFISEEQRTHPFANGKLTGLLLEVLSACKKIAFLTGQGELAGQAMGSAETENVQGEQQKKLDILSNELFIESTQWCGYLAGMASEEMDHSLPVPDKYPRGNYLITFDPLDGSSNIDINVSVGTIFSILEYPEGTEKPTDGDFLQPGVKQVCAGYCLYGTSTMLVLTTGRGVNGFTLDPGTGDFYLTMPDIKLPPQTNEYSINQSYSRHWEPPVKRYIDECLAGEDGPLGKNYNMRWVASMVAGYFYVSDGCSHGCQWRGRQVAFTVRGQPDELYCRAGRWTCTYRTSAHNGHSTRISASKSAGNYGLSF